MDKFQGKYRIPTNRLQGQDYGSQGWYFVTICTQNREYYFGDIIKEPHNCKEPRNCAALQATPIGQIAIDFWLEIPRHYPFVQLDAFVVMPNHIHGLLFLNRQENREWTPNQFGAQSKNLGAIIRAYKSSVKRYANQNAIPFAWQSRYHDSIVRDNKAIQAIRQYIWNNPAKWLNDETKVNR